MGWSSWNAFRVDISEDIIKNQADLMVKKGLKDAGYHYINIDDGFFGERDGNGKMQTNKNRFPNGMKPVADHIHSLGMKAGIYTDAGNNTCGSIWDNDHAGVGAGIYGHVDCNALALLDYSLDKPEQGINCLNKAKILEEVCLALGIYARRVRFLPYSPFDFDCHVVTEIYDRSQEKWYMLDPTTNGYLVDEQGTILSLLEARERMADTRFVTYCKATSREKDLQKLYRKNIARTAYYAKNLFRIQVDAVSQFGESGNWLNFPPEHFSIREWSVASAEYRLEMVPAYAKGYADFDEAVQLPRMREAVERTRNMEEPKAISAAALTEKPIS